MCVLAYEPTTVVEMATDTWCETLGYSHVLAKQDS